MMPDELTPFFRSEDYMALPGGRSEGAGALQLTAAPIPQRGLQRQH